MRIMLTPNIDHRFYRDSAHMNAVRKVTNVHLNSNSYYWLVEEEAFKKEGDDGKARVSIFYKYFWETERPSII